MWLFINNPNEQYAYNKHIRRVRCAVFVSLLFCLLLCSTACTPFASVQRTSGPTAVQQAPEAQLTYVAIGASDTFGIGTDDPQTESWPSDLAALLGKQAHLVNLGIPDMHIHNALTVELPVALDTHPNLITIWLAVNDLADKVPLASYTHDLDLLLTRLQSAAPHARIAVANIPDLTLLPHFQSLDKQLLLTQILAYNGAIATVVNHHQVLLVDLYQSWNELAQHPEYISDDGLHPNELGYTRIAEIFAQFLKIQNP